MTKETRPILELEVTFSGSVSDDELIERLKSLTGLIDDHHRALGGNGISIYIEPGDATKDTVQEVLEKLSDLHIACGGLGLELTVKQSQGKD